MNAKSEIELLAVNSTLTEASNYSTEETTEMGMGFFYFLAAINLLICIVGLFGNALVFYVVCRFSAMQTVTNVFILALAFADIAFLVHIPLLVITSLVGEWWFGNIYCKIYYSVTTINQFASSFLLAVMSADRYLAICLPTRSPRIRTKETSIGVCILVWLIAFALMCPVFMYSGTETPPEIGRTQCNILWPKTEGVDGHTGFALYCFILGFAVPVFLMIVFYGCVLRKLRSSQEKVSTSGSESTIKRHAKLRKVTTMILTVIAVYLLCWSPYWILQFLIVFGTDDSSTSKGIIYTSVTFQCLCFANSSINPILYAVLSENFKQSYARAFKRTRLSKETHTRTTSNPLVHGRVPSSVRDLTEHLPSFHHGAATLQNWLSAEVLFEIRTGTLVAL